VVFCIDPNESPNIIPIAKALEAAGVYYVSWWNKPENVKAWDYPHWVAHVAFDGISAGEFAANVLFKKMGGKGKVVAIKGMLANSIAIDRYKGLENILAKNPGIKLVASDTAEWDRTKAFEKMKSFLVANRTSAGCGRPRQHGPGSAGGAAGRGPGRQGPGDGLRRDLGNAGRHRRGGGGGHGPERLLLAGGHGAGPGPGGQDGQDRLEEDPKEKRQYFARRWR